MSETIIIDCDGGPRIETTPEEWNAYLDWKIQVIDMHLLRVQTEQMKRAKKKRKH